MPNIPVTQPFVSSTVSHAAPQLAPGLNVHMADPLFEERIRNMRFMEKQAKDAIDFTLKVKEEIVDEKQRNIDFQSIMDFNVVDAQKSADLDKQLKNEQNPDNYEPIYNEFQKERINRANQYANTVSRGAWAKMQEYVAGNFAREFPSVTIAAEKKRKEISRAKLFSAITGTINANDPDKSSPVNSPIYKFDSLEATIDQAVDSGIIDVEEAIKMRDDSFRQIAVNENLREAQENTILFENKDERSKFLLDRYLTESDRRTIENERDHQLNVLKQKRVMLAETDWDNANKYLNDNNYFVNADDVRKHCPNLTESKVHSMLQTSLAKERADSKLDVEKKEEERSAKEVMRFMDSRKEVMENPSKDRGTYLKWMIRASFLPPPYRKVLEEDIDNKVSGKADSVPPDMKNALRAVRSDLNSFYSRWAGTSQNRFALREDVEIVDPWFSKKTVVVKKDMETQARLIERYIAIDNEMVEMAKQSGMTPEKFTRVYSERMYPYKEKSLKDRILEGER